jgi:glycosyltransferase involved in cell wall biosynthesis
MSLSKIKICRIATIPFFLVSQLKEQGEYFLEQGMKVNMVSSDGPEVMKLSGCKIVHDVIDIRRNIDLKNDLIALIKLFIYFKKNRFDLVHSTTPKAGLLTALAGYAANIPVVLHSFTGQQWINKRGMIYHVSRLSDRVIGFLNTRCYADSESQRSFLLSEGLIRKNKIMVIGKGSLAGVNMSKFNPSRFSTEKKRKIRSELSISNETIIIIFIGRITKDKGVLDLLQVFSRLQSNQEKKLALLIVGPKENSGDKEADNEIASYLEKTGIHYVGYTETPEDYLAVSDIHCLPSYREGFGTVVIEAAAMGVPTVGTKINGLVDAVENGVTGILVPINNYDALYYSLVDLIKNPVKRKRMGKRAKIRVKSNFNSHYVNNLVMNEYKNILSS